MEASTVRNCVYIIADLHYETPHFMEHSVILNQVIYRQSEISYFFKDGTENLKESLVYVPHVNVVKDSLLQLHNSTSS